jgi:hypothetical protein
VTDYTAQVAGYLAYCRRAAAELKAAGSSLDPRYNPTEAGCLKQVPHRGDPAEAKAIRQAFRDLTEQPAEPAA